MIKMSHILLGTSQVLNYRTGTRRTDKFKELICFNQKYKIECKF